jgi:hypothetical protein
MINFILITFCKKLFSKAFIASSCSVPTFFTKTTSPYAPFPIDPRYSKSSKDTLFLIGFYSTIC